MNKSSFLRCCLLLNAGLICSLPSTCAALSLSGLQQQLVSYAKHSALAKFASNHPLQCTAAALTIVGAGIVTKKLAFPTGPALASVTDTQHQKSEEQFRNDTNLAYLFFPGMHSNATQVAKYTQKFVSDETSEIVESKNGMQVLSNNIVPCKGNEVTNKSLSGDCSYNPCTWLWNKVCYTVSSGANRKFDFSVTPVHGKKRTETVGEHSVNFFANRIGLNEDKEDLIKKFKKTCSETKEKGIIFWGVSRGTAATMHALKELVKLPEFKKRVKAIVLEGAFDSLEHLYRVRFASLAKVMSFETADAIVQSLTAGTSLKDNTPVKSLLEAVNSEGFNVPILIIGSKIDAEVPYECTESLYHTILTQYKNVELVTLEKSSHTGYMFEDKDDRARYQTAVHKFYKKHSLPHIEEYAK